MSTGAELEGSRETEPPAVYANQSSPGRTVLVEDGNADGWIASDLVLELRQ